MRAIEQKERIDAIEPLASPDQRQPVQATTAAQPVSMQRHARQLSALIWIIMAWLIGTLVSELHVTGAELHPTKNQLCESSLGEVAIEHASILQRWESQETEYAIICSGISDLDRVNQNYQSCQAVDSDIEYESDKLEKTPGASQTLEGATEKGDPRELETGREADVGPSPSSADATPSGANATATSEPVHSAKTNRKVATINNHFKKAPHVTLDAEVAVAFQEAPEQPCALIPAETKTALAWKEFPMETFPGLARLVTHSFNEMKLPVHVGVDSCDDNALGTDENAIAAGTFPGSRAAKPSGSLNSPATAATYVAQPPEIVCVRPQLLQVPAVSVMLRGPVTDAVDSRHGD